ncbi:muramidase, partial [Accumulibacter sp.]
PMQFNTAYLRDLAGYGITPDDVAAAGCYAFDLAAWRLRQHIKKDRGDLWTRAANYHSRTPQYNATYRADLLVKSRRWADWLEARFVTVEVTKANALPSMPATPAALQLAPAQTAKVVAMPAQTPVTTVAWNTSGYVPRKIIINGQP